MANQAEELYGSLVQLRDRLAAVQATDELVAIRRDLDLLLVRFQRELLGQEVSDAPALLFERLQSLDPAFDIVSRRWSEFRTDVGMRAAQDIRDHADLFAGWRARWGALFEPAWERRTQLDESKSDLVRKSAVFAVGMPSAGRSRSTFNLALALDLRYGVGLALAQIAALMNLSPAAVQARISDFQDEVLVSVAHRTIERQIPEGWQVRRDSRPGASTSVDMALRRTGAGSQSLTVVLQIVPVWEEREVTVGRPRSAFAASLGPIRPGHLVRIWAVVFSDSGRVVFVPESLMAGTDTRDLTLARVIERAREIGVPVLADAMQSALRRAEAEGGA